MTTLKNKESIIKDLLEEGYSVFTFGEIFAAYNKYEFMDEYDFRMEISINNETPILFFKGSIVFPTGNVSGCCKAVPFDFVNSTNMTFKDLLMNCMREISDQLKDMFGL